MGEAHFSLGVALMKAEKNEEAIEHFGAAVRSRGGYFQAYHNLGLALVKAGRIDEGIRAYRMALSINPDFAPAQTGLQAALTQKAMSPQSR